MERGELRFHIRSRPRLVYPGLAETTQPSLQVRDHLFGYVPTVNDRTPTPAIGISNQEVG